jgi:predicted amidophosphoribosyltransferase
MANVTKEATTGPRKRFRRQQRACLRCDRSFMSTGPHNRLCDTCRETLSSTSTPEDEYSILVLRRGWASDRPVLQT